MGDKRATYFSPKLSKQPENISACARFSSARSDTSFHSTSRSYTLSMQAPPLHHRKSSHIHPADLPDSCVSSAGNSLPACLVWPLIYHATSRYQRVVSAGVVQLRGAYQGTKLLDKLCTNIRINGCFAVVALGRVSPEEEMDNEAAYLTRPTRAFPLNALHKAIGHYRREVSVLRRLDESAKVWLGFGIGEERKNLDEGRKGSRLRCARETAKRRCELAKVMSCECTPKVEYGKWRQDQHCIDLE